MPDILPPVYPIHKGFVPGRNQPGCEKQPAMKFTDKFYSSFEEVKNMPNVLGILNKDIVMIDTDTREDTKAFIRVLTELKMQVPCLITDKGAHFYFKDDTVTSAQTSVMLCCGIVVDIKLGNRNGLDLLRKCEKNRDVVFWNSPLTPLPFWARPLSDSQRCNLPSLANLGKGSRNQTLFTMMGRIKRTGLSYNESVETLKIINYYVIKNPLPADELNSICRKEGYDRSVDGVQPPTVVKQGAIEQMDNVIQFTPINSVNNNTLIPATQQANVDEDKKFNPLTYARALISKYHIKNIGGVPYAYENGEYVKLKEIDMDRLICDVMPDCLIRHRSEIRSRTMIEAPEIDDKENEENRKYINFENGILNIEDNTLVPHNPNIFVPNRIPHAYLDHSVNAEASETLEKFVWQISGGNSDTVKQIYEMAGLCLYRRNFVRGCYILLGPKANGKSTFLNFLSYCLGDNNTESLKMHQLSERFNTQMVDCKLANLGDDISDAYISDSSTLKSLITSDTMLVDVKNKAPYKMTPYATLIFSANNMPRATDATKALLDRLVIVKFPTQFSASNGNLNTDMAALLHRPEIAQEFLRRAVYALQQIRATKQLTIGEVSAEMKREYEIENNSVLSFFTDPEGYGGNLDEKLNKVPLQNVYVDYVAYCRDAGAGAMSRNQFTRFAKNQLNNAIKKVVKINNTTHNAFVRANENEPITVQ